MLFLEQSSEISVLLEFIKDLKGLVKMVEKFNTLYNEVFTEAGEIKACGRNKCKDLISLANKLEKGINHGDFDSGYMNVASIKDLHKRLNSIE